MVFIMVGAFPPPVHGASRATQLLADRIGALGVEVQTYDTSVDNGRTYHLRRLVRYVRAALWIVCMAKTKNMIVYQTGAGGFAIWYQVLVAVASQVAGAKHVYHHHSFAYLDSKSLAMSALVRCGKKTHHLALCPKMAGKLETAYGCRHVSVISNALLMGEAEVLDEEQSNVKEFRLGHLSNLSLEKGLAEVLSAARELRSRGVPARLVLAGPASSGHVESVIRTHLAQESMDAWVGPISPGDVPSYMRSISCFVFPSRYVNEASPLVVLEALREGTPVVASSQGCLGGLLGDYGWVAEREDLGSKIQAVLRDPEARSHARLLYQRELGQGDLGQLLGNS